MGYINLIDQISELDRKKLENYISLYGLHKSSFIGIDAWLQNWSHANQKLYKLLGNNFIKVKNYKFDKKPEDIEREVREKLFMLKFKRDYHRFYWDYIRGGDIDFSQAETSFFNALTDTMNFVNDKIHLGIKFKKDNKPMLQIPEGTKPMKAFQKIIKYFDDYAWDMEAFEEFRLAHSMILNDKVIKGKLCISIFPLDYITMSDNGSDWGSCMSWTDDGCYHAGTIEMMNSNNVLCCYLIPEKDNNDNWNFNRKQYNNEDAPAEYRWNNKKWRQMVYVNKDIIMTGKSYPYYNETISKDLLDFVRETVKENLGWDYTYGPELYRDMIHINSNARMNNNRDWIRYGGANKHNIIWDTNGMYNDMFNDNYYKYWCVRNKVKRNKMISVSGKCNCLACNGPILEFTGDGYYNERFGNAGSAVCHKCANDLRCYECGDLPTDSPLIKVRIKGDSRSPISICENCFNRKVRLCPCCNKPMWMEFSGTDEGKFYRFETKRLITEPEDCHFAPYFGRNYSLDTDELEECGYNAERLYVCENCKDSLISDGRFKEGEVACSYRWGREKECPKIKVYYTLDKDFAHNFETRNLKKWEDYDPSEIIQIVKTYE